MDYTTLQQTQDVNQLLDQGKGILAFAFWFSLIITIVFVIMLLIGMIRKWKVQSAVLDMHKLLIEMNERDKASHQPVAPAPVPHPSSRIATAVHDDSASA